MPAGLGSRGKRSQEVENMDGSGKPNRIGG
jgi:hypothetical protein